MLVATEFPLAICYILENSTIIRVSSCLDAGFRPTKEQFKELGYTN